MGWATRAGHQESTCYVRLSWSGSFEMNGHGEDSGVRVLRTSALVRKVYLWVGLALGVLLLVLAVRGVDPTGLRRSLAGTEPWLVALGLLTVAATIVAKALRWKLLFYPAQEGLRLTTLVSALLVGQTINFLLPARVGEFARVFLVRDGEKRHALLALGTIIVEKTLDGLALIVLLGILFVVMPVPPWLRLSGGAVTLVTALLLAVVLLLTGGRQRVVSASERLWRLVPALERLGLNRRIEALADGLGSLQVSGVQARLLVWTAVIWVLAGLTNYIVLLALGIEAPLVLASLLVLTVVHLGLVVPTSPARIGVFHYLCLLSLSVLGVDESQALAYGFVLHLIVVLPLIGAGLVCLWKENLSLYRLVAEVEGR
jgi:uncharacterized protein (TIRG00374 family)